MSNEDTRRKRVERKAKEVTSGKDFSTKVGKKSIETASACDEYEKKKRC